MNPRIATGLAFGIRTDTLGFTRHFNPVDIRALSWLNAYVDFGMLRSIEEPPRSQETLESFSRSALVPLSYRLDSTCTIIIDAES